MIPSDPDTNCARGRWARTEILMRLLAVLHMRGMKIRRYNYVTGRSLAKSDKTSRRADYHKR